MSIRTEILLDRPAELQQKIFARLFDAARVSRMDKVERHKYRRTMITKRDIWCIQETDRRMAREEGWKKKQGRGEEEWTECRSGKGAKESRE